MLNYAFDDFMDLSNNEHYALAQILDNMTGDDYSEEFQDYFSIGTEE